MIRIRVVVCTNVSFIQYTRSREETYGRQKQDNEGCVVPASDTVVDPLTVVIAAIDTVIALLEKAMKIA